MISFVSSFIWTLESNYLADESAERLWCRDLFCSFVLIIISIGVGDGGSGTHAPNIWDRILFGQLLRKIRAILGQKSREIRKFC